MTQYRLNPWERFTNILGMGDGLEYIDPSSIASKLGPNGTPLTPQTDSMFGNLFDRTDPKTGVVTQGWGGLALQGLGTVGNLWNSWNQYGLAKDQLKFSKDSFNKNYAAQRTLINADLEDRQRARVASNPGAYQSVGAYMDQNRIR